MDAESVWADFNRVLNQEIPVPKAPGIQGSFDTFENHMITFKITRQIHFDIFERPKLNDNADEGCETAKSNHNVFFHRLVWLVDSGEEIQSC